MKRRELERYILELYGAVPDHPWAKFPRHAVFRHATNRKWFALVMELPGEKLGLPEVPWIDVVNLKCDPALIGTLRQEKGFFPADHMNKDKWITVMLDDDVPAEKLKILLDMSYNMTSSLKPIGRKEQKRGSAENFKGGSCSPAGAVCDPAADPPAPGDGI